MKSTPPPPSIKRLAIGVTLCSVSFLGLILLLYTETFRGLGDEDGIMENAGALSFFIASVLFFRTFLKMRQCKEPQERGMGAGFWFLILAALFFFIAGEEISWGQRIFGWATPDWVKEDNLQQETNIHNLEFFHADNKDDELKSFSARLLSMNRLFSIFWLSWCLILPLAVRLSPKARQLVEWFRIPIPLTFFGCCFFATYATAKIFVITFQPEDSITTPIDELKEAYFAFIFVMVSWDFSKRLITVKGNQAT